MKKILAISIILLFIGIAVAPSINQSVVTASQDDDLVEITTQTCGIKGYGDTTVKLTRQQYSDLEQYLVEFRARLNQTTTKEEAIPLFKDAVVELHTHGLLPRRMSVEKAQQLVTIGYHLQMNSTIIEYLNLDLINYFCLFAAIVSGSMNANIWTYLSMYIAMLTVRYFGYYDIPPLLEKVIEFLFIFGTIKPLHVDLGIMNVFPESRDFYFSIGAGGVKIGNDIFSVLGFVGLKIILPYEHNSTYFPAFYLGFAGGFK